MAENDFPTIKSLRITVHIENLKMRAHYKILMESLSLSPPIASLFPKALLSRQVLERLLVDRLHCHLKPHKFWGHVRLD